jgi:uncharacterized membrane protein YebE (DUF533 family)
MSAQSMLEQLLRQGMTLLNDRNALPATRSAPTQAPAAAGASGGAGRSADWSSFGAGAATGAAATGALGLLLGHKQARRYAGKAVKYGGIAAIGLMAYRAYSQWQADQAQRTQPAAPVAAPVAPALTAPRTVDRLPEAEVEPHSRAMLAAMIAAAKADGHLDERERGLLESELTRLAADHALRQWMEGELRRPLDPAEVARAAAGQPELAAELYLVSLLVADDQSFMERAYLDELARQLGLDAGLKARLEAQAAEG